MNIFASRIMAALVTAFNVLALNAVMIVVALPVVTLPVAVNAATVALDRWRREGEDRVVREFIIALRSRPPLRTTALLGVPLGAVALGVLEVRHFARYGAPADRLGLGIGLGALLITLTAIGYVLVLTARDVSGPVTDLWSLSARLAVKNLFVTGPLFALEIAAAVLLAVIDPALLFLGVPVLLLALLRRTAQFGLERSRRVAD
jgi:hypothetical protein